MAPQKTLLVPVVNVFYHYKSPDTVDEGICVLRMETDRLEVAPRIADQVLHLKVVELLTHSKL